MESLNKNTPSLSQIFDAKKTFRCCSIGPTSSGKSYQIMQMIKDPRYKILDQFQVENIYIFSPTCQVDDSQQQLIEFLKSFKNNKKESRFNEDEQLIIKSEDISMKLKQLYDSKIEEKKLLREKKQELQPTLCILDDLLGDQNVNLRNGIIPSLFTKIRHGNISCILLIQYMLAIPPQVRLQQNIFLVYGLSQKDDIQKLYKETSGTISKSEFLQIYKESTNDQYGFLGILTNLNPQYRFFNNFKYQYQLL